MSVRVRLTRVGSKKNPIWRVVVADQRSPRDGRFIETIGQYNPQTEPSTIRIDEERFDHWVARGAQASGTVKQLMKAQAKSGGVPEPAPEAATPVAAPDGGEAAAEGAAPAPDDVAEAEAADAPDSGDVEAAEPADDPDS
jgi:small subunit ribosomal protein S16